MEEHFYMTRLKKDDARSKTSMTREKSLKKPAVTRRLNGMTRWRVKKKYDECQALQSLKSRLTTLLKAGSGSATGSKSLKSRLTTRFIKSWIRIRNWIQPKTKLKLNPSTYFEAPAWLIKITFSSVSDTDPHGCRTFAWIWIRNYSSGSWSSKNERADK